MKTTNDSGYQATLKKFIGALNSTTYDNSTDANRLEFLKRMKDTLRLSTLELNAVIDQYWDDMGGHRIFQMPSVGSKSSTYPGSNMFGSAYKPDTTDIPLRIATLNVGYNVMSNSPQGTERPLVELCQLHYSGPPYHKGWHDKNANISQCTYNSSDFLTDYDIFGLQEVNGKYQQSFEDTIKSTGKLKDRDYKLVSSYYFGNWAVTIGFDKNIVGDGIRITPDNFLIGRDPKNFFPKANTNDMRGAIAIYFPKIKTVFINLHAPHNMYLVAELESIGKQLEKNFVYMFKDLKLIDRVLVTGDFNDDRGLLVNKSISMLGKRVRIPVVDTSLIPKSCCADSKYKLIGDYVLDSKATDSDLKSGKVYFGFPIIISPNKNLTERLYDRNVDILSDHDPVVLLDDYASAGIKSNILKKEKAGLVVEEMKTEPNVYEGVVRSSGSYIEIQLNLNQDQLLGLAKKYIDSKNLKWDVRKPYAWTEYNSMPHITLASTMKKHIGEKVKVRLGDLYHFTSGNSRWVAIIAELPPGYKCEYECHLSIAQQRVV